MKKTLIVLAALALVLAACGSDDDTTSDLPTAGDTITVTEAATTSGTVSVTGFVVDIAGQTRLCEALAESFPPQCGGARILLSDLSQVNADQLKTEGDVTWTDDYVVVTGTMVDGTLVTE